MLDALDGGLDLVTGRRAIRRDRLVKRWTSRFYNWTTRRLTGVDGRDFNSGFKAMRAEVAESFELYGDLHRYIPVLAAWSGYRVGEIPVNHRPREHGQSKFGRARFWRGYLDLLTVKFLTTYTNRPLHLLGSIGTVLSGAGFVILAYLSVDWVFGTPIGTRPALDRRGAPRDRRHPTDLVGSGRRADRLAGAPLERAPRAGGSRALRGESRDRY